MLRGALLAEERDRTLPLVQKCAKACAGGVTVDNENFVEIGELQDGSGGEGELQGVEGGRRLRSPLESLFLKERRERRSDGAIVGEWR
jgi:hypothetical protein